MAQGSRDRKILRIGIIQNGKIIEERLLRKRETVLVGQAPRNTFVLPSAGVPRSYPIFELKGGVYSLNFKSDMSGKVSVDDAVLDLAAIRSQNLAKKKGDGFVLPLSEKSRGKVVIDDVTILFQFVTPPPPASKLQLPASVRGGWIKSIDWPFTNIMLGSFIFQVFSIAFIATRDYPEPPRGIDTLPDRFKEILISTPPEPPEAKPDTEKEKKDEEGEKPVEKKPEEVKPKPQPKVEKVETPEDQARRKAKDLREMNENVKNRTILKVVGALGEDGNIVNALGGGAAEVAMKDAFTGTGIEMAKTEDAGRDRRGVTGGTGDVAGIANDELIGKGPTEAVESGTKAKEVKVSGAVSVKNPSEVIGMGKLTSAEIATVVRRRQGAIKSCYEKELKRDPKLAGKVTIRFTIQTSGRVGSTSVLENSTNSRAVATCIESNIKRWRFPKPDGGDVTVAFPFVFTPSG